MLTVSLGLAIFALIKPYGALEVAETERGLVGRAGIGGSVPRAGLGFGLPRPVP